MYVLSCWGLLMCRRSSSSMFAGGRISMKCPILQHLFCFCGQQESNLHEFLVPLPFIHVHTADSCVDIVATTTELLVVVRGCRERRSVQVVMNAPHFAGSPAKRCGAPTQDSGPLVTTANGETGTGAGADAGKGNSRGAGELAALCWSCPASSCRANASICATC